MWSISKISIYSISGLYEGHGLEDAAYLVVEAIVDDRAARKMYKFMLKYSRKRGGTEWYRD